MATAPGAEKASQRVANRFCDLFAISDEAQQRDLLVNLEMHILESGEVYFINIKSFNPNKKINKLYAYRYHQNTLKDNSINHFG